MCGCCSKYSAILGSALLACRANLCFIISQRVNAPRKSSERQDRGTAKRALLKVKYQYQILLTVIANIALTINNTACHSRAAARQTMSNMKQTTERALPTALYQNVETQNDIVLVTQNLLHIIFIIIIIISKFLFKLI